jgi:hypothetical protein
MHEKSTIEKVSGSLVASGAANALAVAGAAFSPWAAFAPYLLQTLASRRQSERVEQMLGQLARDISALRVDMDNITDDQYKLVGECIVTTFSTVNTKKLEYIRSAVLNSLTTPTLSLDTGDALGRVVRDISAAEAAFLLTAFQFRAIVIAAGQVPTVDTRFISPGSPEELLVGGLIRLGLLYNRSSMKYEWSPLTAKFIALISPQTQPNNLT